MKKYVFINCLIIKGISWCNNITYHVYSDKRYISSTSSCFVHKGVMIKNVQKSIICFVIRGLTGEFPLS